MRVFKTSLLLAWAATATARPALKRGAPSCRFALQYNQSDILDDPTDFIMDLLYWEGQFHQNSVGYNTLNGMSYDGTQIDLTTGLATFQHNFSAPSKESLQFMIYAHAINGSQQAAQFLSPSNPAAAPDIAASILETKLATYLKFNETYPGFGGFLPWYNNAKDVQDISPAWNWVNLVPALDNGELLWAVYSAIEVLENSPKESYQRLAQDWQRWLDYTKTTAAKIFYAGQGQVCAVTAIQNQSWPVNDPRQNYSCSGDGRINDPYEGELFTWWLQFFGGLSENDKQMLWEVKRPQLVSVEYDMGGVGPITVQEGYWFSSHEQWKVLEMPYYDVDIIRRLYNNAERARTCNSVVTKVPGMFASVNNSTDPSTGQIIGYISNAGIPSIANQTVQELDVITPYSVFPTLLFDQKVGLAWWRNMVIAKKMQNPYGSTESARIDGILISGLVTWDSKMTTVNALLGGVSDFVRQRMIKDGIYQEFIDIIEGVYTSVFKDLKGENIPYCLPEETIPDRGLEDFTECN
ncbi:hypothetical protein VTN77DRAFT_4534 [Rasamsonia byssochlamydoides]|uniref:uncharacterized protein n=1 Tax=Rasamsonia byssochlamydoides TaxID=89139 RepID=UPI003743196C